MFAVTSNKITVEISYILIRDKYISLQHIDDMDVE
jgi:hypothetical protein